MQDKKIHRKREFSSTCECTCNHDDILAINKVLLLLNERGDPLFLFQNLSSYKINNWQRFDKNLNADSISEE